MHMHGMPKQHAVKAPDFTVRCMLNLEKLFCYKGQKEAEKKGDWAHNRISIDILDVVFVKYYNVNY